MGVVQGEARARGAVGGLFVVAVFAWGLGFYGLGFHLRHLHELRGWSLGTITSVTFGFHLLATAQSFAVARAVERLGPRAVFVVGGLALGLGTAAIGRVGSLALLGCAYAVLSVGWACTNSNPISATVLAWYPARPGPPLTAALTGASIGGIVLIPALGELDDRFGFTTTLTIAAVVASALVVGVALAVLPRPPQQSGMVAARTSRIGIVATRRFGLLAIGLSLAIASQVGFLIHQLNVLSDVVSSRTAGIAVALTTAAALVGRLPFAAASRRWSIGPVAMGFLVCQASALVLLGVGPTNALAVVVAGPLFGLGVGVLITIPSLLTRATFPDEPYSIAFPLVNLPYQIGVAAGPGLTALAHRAFGGYGGAALVLASLDLISVGALAGVVRINAAATATPVATG